MKASDTAARDLLVHQQRRARRPVGQAPLTRARQGRWIAGVAHGIARFVGTRASVVRVLWLLSLVLSLGVTALGYLALWVLLPAESLERHAGDAPTAAPSAQPHRAGAAPSRPRS